MSTISRAEAFAPGTSANLGVGFDILGMALEGIGDRVEAIRTEEPRICIQDITGDGGVISREASKNTAGIAVDALLSQLDVDWGVCLIIHKGIPLSSGLGGSAASAVAAVMAVNALLKNPLPREQLLPPCIEGESVISGYHADNIAPCLLGGITLVSGTDIDSIRHLPIPSNLHLALVTPDVELPTKEARSILPSVVPLKQLVTQTAAVANFVDALHCNDVWRAAEAMGSDSIIEPARVHLVPCFNDIREAAKACGAISTVISGAGPTICGFCDSKETANAVNAAMQQVYAEAGINCNRSLVTAVDGRGANVVSWS